MYRYLIPEQLERNSPRPIYTQMYEQLKRELVLGNHQPGKRFFSYRKLKDIYKTELRTIASAIDLLIDDGLIEKRGNSGIYVKEREKISDVGHVWYAVMSEQTYHPFFFNVLFGLSNEAEKYGLRVVVRVGRDREEFLRWFQPRPGEGLILTGEVDDALLKAAGKKCDNHVIAVGNYDLHREFGRVVLNCYDAVCRALRLAAVHGCRRFALITGAREFLISRNLHEAVTECAAGCGAGMKYVEERSENGYTAMKELAAFRPDCVLVTEPAFSGAWEYMLENALKCPEDIFLIRYGKEQKDNTLAGRAAVEIESDSAFPGVTALQMLLKNSKDTVRLDLEVNSVYKE